MTSTRPMSPPQLTKQHHIFIVRDALTHLNPKQCLKDTLNMQYFRNRMNSTDISMILSMLREQGMTFTLEEVRHYHEYVPATRRSRRIRGRSKRRKLKK